ncbi:MAG: pyridoxine 5'-phosphate synthase [Hyphomicrobiaceae bacterium TMED74]|nr:pyridoxine 5'-phosphate synthase [Filomicrobium sp.]RPG36668.1 MAG: pyridoxine 5'-phosphate synthase [Hyphomicrobiaceae bacterium TMED74]
MFQPSGSRQRLGVNVDHVATIRNARGGMHPDPVRAALTAIDAGADSITVHLREDRRHISDIDIAQLRQKLKHPLNLEMAATEEMLSIALSHRPAACCLVPERRDERTTEGGLDVASDLTYLGRYIYDLQSTGCRVSLFIDPDIEQIDASRKIAADVVELHTGRYCEAALANDAVSVEMELERIRAAAEHAHNRGLEVHAGHGLTYATVPEIAKIDPIIELNIGHFLIGEAIFCGLHSAVERMRSVMDYARGEVKLKDTA